MADTSDGATVIADDSLSSPQPTAERGRASLAAGFRIVSLCTLLSRVLGLGRDIVLAALFGAGPILDSFTVAFRVPNLARQLFGEGALTSAFLPIFVRELHSAGQEAARRMASAVFIALAGVLIIVVGAAELVLVTALRNAALSADARLLLELLAILTPYLLFICLAAQVSAVLHALRHFLWPALLPVVLNLVWLAGAGFAAMWWDAPLPRIRAIAASLVAGGALQLAIALWALENRGFSLAPDWRTGWPRTREVFVAMLPIVLGLSVTQFNTMLDSLMAWALAAPEAGSTPLAERFLPVLVESGTASALYFGQRMYQFPLGVFGVALGTVLFPLLAHHAQAGDREALRADLAYGVRLSIAIGVPAAAGLVVLSGPITALLFQHGRFDAEDARLTSQMVAVYGSAAWAYIGLLIVHRGFYAVGDRTTPVKIGLVSVAINLSLNIALVWRLGGVGLAAGTAIATALQTLLALRKLETRTGRLDWRGIGGVFGKTLAAGAAMTATCAALSRLLPAGESLPARAIAVAAPLLGGAGVYFATAALIGLSEPWELLRRRSRL